MNLKGTERRGKMQTSVNWIRRLIFLLVSALPVVNAWSAAGAAELTLSDLQAREGQERLSMTLLIDHVEKLAGIKLVLRYDKELLTFKGAARTKSTDSMMHVVNDKTPGKLIVVMAGARGITGRDIELLSLWFSVKKGLTGNRETLVEIMETQLMGDDLKEIPCRAKSGRITIVKTGT